MQTLTRGSYAQAGSSIEFRTGDWRLAHPIHRHREAPCAAACPAGENPQAYLAKAAEGDLRSAWETLVKTNPMPAITGRVCHHPCEQACNRGLYDEPIAIHGVERFLGDRAIAEGWAYPLQPLPPGAPAVAIIGGGPAGLSAAYHLVMHGYKATVFEAQPELGGLLRSALPPYRLPREVLDQEVERLMATGIVYEGNKRIGRDISIDEVRSNFGAVLITIGNGRPRQWSVNGAAPPDLRSAIDLLKEWMSIGAIPSYKRVAIVGGGSTAIDLARVLKFNGALEVHVITFQSLPTSGECPTDVMSAAPRGILEAVEEGVTIHPHRSVRRLILRDEAIVGVEIAHTREIDRGEGKPELVAFEGTEAVLKVDQVIPAVGQMLDPRGFEHLLGTASSFVVDEFGELAGHPGIFVGGDARGSGGSVSGAIGDGRRAAAAIRAFVEGLEPSRGTASRPIAFSELNVHYYDHGRRTEAPIIAAASRSAEIEIEGSLTRGELDKETQRCFSCGECMACDNCWTLCPDNSVLKARNPDDKNWHYLFDYDHCKGCGICAHECPVGFIAMVDDSGV